MGYDLHVLVEGYNPFLRAGEMEMIGKLMLARTGLVYGLLAGIYMQFDPPYYTEGLPDDLSVGVQEWLEEQGDEIRYRSWMSEENYLALYKRFCRESYLCVRGRYFGRTAAMADLEGLHWLLDNTLLDDKRLLMFSTF